MCFNTCREPEFHNSHRARDTTGNILDESHSETLCHGIIARAIDASDMYARARIVESNRPRHVTRRRAFAVMSTVTTANATTRARARDARDDARRAMRAGGEDRRRARADARASDDDDGGRRILGRGNARARGGSTARRVERAALPHAFETSWWVEQAATCGVILAAYGAMATTRAAARTGTRRRNVRDATVPDARRVRARGGAMMVKGAVRVGTPD